MFSKVYIFKKGKNKINIQLDKKNNLFKLRILTSLIWFLLYFPTFILPDNCIKNQFVNYFSHIQEI